MKRITTLLGFLFTLLSVNAQYEEINDYTNISQSETKHNTDTALEWENNFEKAIDKSRKESKPILMFFTASDWCEPCKELEKEVFETVKFENYAKENFVLFKADYPRNKDLIDANTRLSNAKLSKYFRQYSFPTILIIDAQNNVYASRKGKYMDSYFNFFNNAILKVKNKKYTKFSDYVKAENEKYEQNQDNI